MASTSIKEWVEATVASMPSPGADVGSSDGATLLRLAEDAARVEAAAAAVKARVLAAAESVRAAQGRGGRSASELFAERTRISPGQAARLVRQGDDIIRYPELGARFVAGDVGVQSFQAAADQIRSVTPGLTREQVAEADRIAAQATATTSARGLHTLGEELLTAVAPETKLENMAERAGRQRRRAWGNRSFELREDGQGSILLRGSLPVLEGRRLELALATLTRRPRQDGAELTGSHRRADALVELAQRVTAGSSNTDGGGLRAAGPQAPSAPCAATSIAAEIPTTPGPGEPSNVPVAQSSVSAGPGDAASTAAGPWGSTPRLDGMRPTMLILLEYNALVRDLAALGKLSVGVELPGQSTLVARTLHGDVLSPQQVRLLACESDLVPVVLGGGSEILDIGRASRYATPAQRKALALRDGGCVFPGCHAPPEACDKHHIVPWELGGRTDVDNLVLLCPHHHREVEPVPNRADEHNWRVELRPGGCVLVPPRRVDAARRPMRHERFRRPLTPAPPPALADLDEMAAPAGLDEMAAPAGLDEMAQPDGRDRGDPRTVGRQSFDSRSSISL